MHYYIHQTKDVELIKDLHSQTFPSDDFYEHKGNVLWVLKDCQKKPVGFCMATDIGDKIVFLSRAGLLSKARGKGLHLRMIHTRINWAKNNGYHSVITYVSIENVQSSRNLLKAGLEIYRPDYEYAGENYNYFRKVL